jgi:hypothetical protein
MNATRRSINAVNESIRRRKMAEQNAKMQHAQMNQMMQQQQMMRQPQPQPQQMNGNLSNDIRPMGNVDNGSGWFTPEEMMSMQQQPQPQPQQMNVPEPDDTEIRFESIFKNQQPQPQPQQYSSIDEVPVPDHEMTFGPQDPVENQMTENMSIEQPYTSAPPNQMAGNRPVLFGF